MENLLLCSRTLYDKDLLDKTREIEELKKEIERLKKFEPAFKKDIVMYGNTRCPYTRGAVQLFSIVRLVDVDTHEGREEFEETGATGTPFFKSEKTGKTFTGWPGNTERLINKLR